MFHESDQQFIVDFMENYRNEINAIVQVQSLRDWLLGECCVAVEMKDFRGLGAWIEMHAVATSRGMQHGNAARSVGMIRYAPDPIMNQDIRR
ncbi:MAG: hypothetical protein IT424_01815 [Pirellulales bacterium]|nr:hypothetical protein [Pirellulales bacterium]